MLLRFYEITHAHPVATVSSPFAPFAAPVPFLLLLLLLPFLPLAVTGGGGGGRIGRYTFFNLDSKRDKKKQTSLVIQHNNSNEH